jgi:hypothetical protein
VTVLAAFSAALSITIWPQGSSGPAIHRTLVCPGDARCAQLTNGWYAQVPKDVMCSQVYGGPQQAIVTGRFDGKKIWTRFTRTDSCQTHRWDRVAFLFRT